MHSRHAACPCRVVCPPALLSVSTHPVPFRSWTLACAEMVMMCEPLCHFGDRYALDVISSCSTNSNNPPNRLFFTTFPQQPPLPPDILNKLAAESDMKPRVRSRSNPWGLSATPDHDDAPYYYFTIDDKLVYMSFFQDWGPLNIAMVYKACILIHELLEVNLAACSPCLNLTCSVRIPT